MASLSIVNVAPCVAATGSNTLLLDREVPDCWEDAITPTPGVAAPQQEVAPAVAAGGADVAPEASRAEDTAPAPAAVARDPSQIDCRYTATGKNCYNSACPFRHPPSYVPGPAQCRYGANCRIPNCPRTHAGGGGGAARAAPAPARAAPAPVLAAPAVVSELEQLRTERAALQAALEHSCGQLLAVTQERDALRGEIQQVRAELHAVIGQRNACQLQIQQQFFMAQQIAGQRDAALAQLQRLSVGLQLPLFPAPAAAPAAALPAPVFAAAGGGK